MKEHRPTIDDVARQAGVGRTTVSRVLNNGPNVRPEVRERVLKAVDALGYRVNIQARFLAGGISRTVAMICQSDPETEPNSYYQAGLELGALRACAPHGMQLITHMVLPNDGSTRASVLELVNDRQCAGVILTPPFCDDAALIGALQQRQCAVVCISPADLEGAHVPSVGIDDEEAGAELGRHLLSLGHRRFGFITGIAGHVAAERRFSGVLRALEEAGIADTHVAVRRGNFTFTSGIERLPELLHASPRPSAVICANDDTAAGALFAAHRIGVEVPADLSITGFDDTPVSQIVWPPLTTVHQPIKSLGARAVEMVAALLNGTAPIDGALHERLEHALVVRGSTAPLSAAS
ncbi:MAG: LacI family DNA-binding transcriptional regulator [Sphingomonas sp.]